MTLCTLVNNVIWLHYECIKHSQKNKNKNHGGGEIFRTCPDWPRSPPSLLYNEYQVFPGGKAAGAWRLQPTPSTAKVK